jgi:hypothetical protein
VDKFEEAQAAMQQMNSRDFGSHAGAIFAGLSEDLNDVMGEVFDDILVSAMTEPIPDFNPPQFVSSTPIESPRASDFQIDRMRVIEESRQTQSKWGRQPRSSAVPLFDQPVTTPDPWPLDMGKFSGFGPQADGNQGDPGASPKAKVPYWDAQVPDFRKDMPGFPASTPFTGAQAAQSEAMRDLGGAIDDFSYEMIEFITKTTDAIRTLTFRLNTANRELQAEGYDIR